MSKRSTPQALSRLRKECQGLRVQLKQLEETLLAIQNGQADAIMASGGDGDHYALTH